MSEHTPGPWVKDYGATKGHIKSLGVPQPAGQDWKPTPTVARYDVETPSLSEAEKEANAALIAAAPELLDELISAVAILTALLANLEGVASAKVCDDIRARIEAGKAAMAKAEGR